MPDREAHWNQTYAGKANGEVSWFQASAVPSLRVIESTGLGPEARVVDVGGGASPLAGELVARGFRQVTVLDISSHALALARETAGARGEAIAWLAADVLDWRPAEPFDLWHDRAVFHFLTEPAERDRYLETLEHGLALGGWLVIATFAPDGPEGCSGLPVQRWSAEALAAELGPRFELNHSFGERHSTPRGAEQSFTWCLFRRV